MGFWKNKKVLVTGGAGFLGSYVVEKLKKRGCRNIFVPRSRDYDLVEIEAVKRLYQDSNPDLVIHLAAVVGGIGANHENPGKFFYDNIMMGVQMMEEGRRWGIEKFIGLGTVCCYPKLTPVPFKEEDLWNGYPEETNAPYGLAKKMLLVQSQAYRKQYGFNSIFLMPVNLYGPCFSQDTDVMTKDGIKNIKEINTEDIVYTLNPESFEMEESKVIATQKIPANEMFIFKNKSVDFRITPEHKVFYRTSTGFVKRRADFFRSRAGKEYGQITFAFHKPKKEGVYPKFVDLSKYIDEKHIRLKNGYVKDFGSSKGNSSRPFPLKYESEDFARFLGWYISEGSAHRRIPKFVFDWSPNLLRLLFETMMKGDGHKNGRKYSTKSLHLMRDFLYLAFLCGINVGAVWEDDCWRVSMRNCKKNMTLKYKDISIEQTNEMAYCITTDRNHIIYAGRNLKFNWIGQCDNFDPKSSHVIPAIIKKCFDAIENGDKEIVLWGTGKPTREFLYVEDCAEAITRATERYNKPEPVNIGAGFEISIKELAQLIAKFTGFKGRIIWDASKPNGQPRRCLDTTRAEKEFDFKARTPFEEGLRKTIEWYRNTFGN